MANFLEDLLRGDPKTNPTPIEYGTIPQGLEDQYEAFGTSAEPMFRARTRGINGPAPERRGMQAGPIIGDTINPFGEDGPAQPWNDFLTGDTVPAINDRKVQEALQDANPTGTVLSPADGAAAARSMSSLLATSAPSATPPIALDGSGARPQVPPLNSLVPLRQSSDDDIADLITDNPQLLKVGKQELFALLHGIPIQGRTEIIDRINSMNQAARDASDVFLPIPYGGR